MIPFSHPVCDSCAPAGADRRRGIPARWNIRELARVAAAGLSALGVCSPMLFAARPKTPLRVFCIAAFEFLARLQGRKLGKRRRMAMALACDFGSLCDDFYDHRRLDGSEYRLLRAELRRIAPEAATARYLQELRSAERARPSLSATGRGVAGVAAATIAYRIQVLDLSLRWMQEISSVKVEKVQFDVLLSLVGLMQIADDVLDWKEDQAGACPSYVTAFLLERPAKGVGASLRAEADALLRRVLHPARHDARTAPFALAGVLTWRLVLVLIQIQFPR